MKIKQGGEKLDKWTMKNNAMKMALKHGRCFVARELIGNVADVLSGALFGGGYKQEMISKNR